MASAWPASTPPAKRASLAGDLSRFGRTLRRKSGREGPVWLEGHRVAAYLVRARVTGSGRSGRIGDPIDLATSPSSKKNVAVPDTRTTGILVGSASSIHVLISGNRIARNHFGIFLE